MKTSRVCSYGKARILPSRKTSAGWQIGKWAGWRIGKSANWQMGKSEFDIHACTPARLLAKPITLNSEGATKFSAKARSPVRWRFAPDYINLVRNHEGFAFFHTFCRPEVMNVVQRVTIDGSYGEGGGQILRSSLALSALTGKPLRIFNIRAGRKNPGLRPQHLTAVKAAAAICDAKVDGAKVNSTELNFEPTNLRSGSFVVDVSADQPSAGSGTLVFQTVFPALLFANQPSSVRIVRCGTHVPFSPPHDYIAKVFLPMVKTMGAIGELRLVKAGWFPRGGGEIEASVQPVNQPLKPINLTERGTLKRIWVFSALSNLKRSIAVRQANQVVNRLLGMGFRQNEIEVEISELPSPSTGTVVLICAEFESVVAGFSALGELGKPAEKVADEAVDDFAEYWHTNAPVDRHLADQLVLFMALANGKSVITTSALTQHALTHIWVIEQFLPVQFEVRGNLNEPATIDVEGLGFLRQN